MRHKRDTERSDDQPELDDESRHRAIEIAALLPSDPERAVRILDFAKRVVVFCAESRAAQPRIKSVVQLQTIPRLGV